MTRAARQVLDELRRRLRAASVATAGGFRPPEDPLTSWYCRGVGRPGEGLPTWEGERMFPLLQVRIDELPYVPQQLEHLSLLVLFHNLRRHPIGLPHGDGWMIREYRTTDNLVPLPDVDHSHRAFPIRWSRIDDDAPGWEDAWSLLDLSAVSDDDDASEAFHHEFNRYRHTKVGGYPCEIQHGVGLDDFVFQVGSEEKVKWVWADNGIGHFFRSQNGEWRWFCQFY